MGLFNRWSLNAIFIFASLVYLGGLVIDVLEVDSAQYAAISAEMHRNGSMLEVYQNGGDYLDKPPLVFWTAAWMYEIFGIHNWSFKLSSMLFSLIGLFSTYKVGYLLYNKRTGYVAMLMLVTCQAYFLFSRDVKTDALLTGAVIFSVWQLVAYLYYKKWGNLILGFAAIGVAMLAKGPIGIMVPALAMGAYLIGKKNYKDIFKWQWLVGLGITALVLLPMSYGLYTQFDAQPEKEVTFQTSEGSVVRVSVSGLKFFYWDQSFGRITGANKDWSNHSGVDFFFGIFAYSFMPWALIGFWAITWRIFNAARDFILKRKKQEWLTLGGFVIPFAAFSMSQFKLDHYIYVTYPFAAIIVAEFILRVIEEKPSWWTTILIAMQSLVILISCVVIYGTAVWALPSSSVFVWFGIIILLGLTFYFLLVDRDRLHKIVLSSVFISLAVNWTFNFHFFKTLSSEYQIGKKVVLYLEDQDIETKDLIVSSEAYVHQLNFYAQSNLNVQSALSIAESSFSDKYLLVKENELDEVLKTHPNATIEKEFHYFHVSKLNWKFLNPETRANTIRTNYLVHLQ